MHVKTLVVPHDGGTLFADLKLVRTPEGLQARVRITRNLGHRHSVERFMGTAELNRALELVRYVGLELSDGERAAIERALVDHVGAVE